MLIHQENSSQTGRVEAGAKEQLPGIVQPYLAAISATVTGLDDPLIPFALLQHDPCPAFEQYMATSLQAQEGAQNVLDTAREAWMRPFADLRTDQLFFVYAWSSVAGSSSARSAVFRPRFRYRHPRPIAKTLVYHPARDEARRACGLVHRDRHERNGIATHRGGHLLRRIHASPGVETREGLGVASPLPVLPSFSLGEESGSSRLKPTQHLLLIARGDADAPA